MYCEYAYVLVNPTKGEMSKNTLAKEKNESGYDTYIL